MHMEGQKGARKTPGCQIQITADGNNNVLFTVVDLTELYIFTLRAYVTVIAVEGLITVKAHISCYIGLKGLNLYHLTFKV